MSSLRTHREWKQPHETDKHDQQTRSHIFLIPLIRALR